MKMPETEEQQEIREYADEKIRMLKEDFYVSVTPDEVDHFRMLVDKYAIDRYARDIIMTKTVRSEMLCTRLNKKSSL